MFPVVWQTIAATPPLLSVKMAYRKPKTGLGCGVSQQKLASEAYRAIWGVTRYSITNCALVTSGTLSFKNYQGSIQKTEKEGSILLI